MVFFGFNIFRGFLGLLMLPLAILAAFWTYKDAGKRNLSPLLWAGISFLVFPVGFIIYISYRLFSKNKL